MKTSCQFEGSTPQQLATSIHESTLLRAQCFQTVVLGKIPERALDCKEIQPISPKGNQPWICMRRTDAEAPIFWPPDAKSRLTGKDPDVGQDWRRKEKRVVEDEMVRENHRLNGHEFEQTPGDRGGQRSLVCCSAWGRIQLSESDTTERLNKRVLWEPLPQCQRQHQLPSPAPLAQRGLHSHH